MYREEYPRPQFVRENWLNLNGCWEFEFADSLADNSLLKQAFSKAIEVPFAFQSEQSGIHETGYHDVVWYRRTFQVPEEWREQAIQLHFGAVDYHCWLYINHQFVGEHIGGHTSFSFDISEYLTGEQEEITLKVFDPAKDETIPRGKQYWQEQAAAIWYTRTTGIWQTVWLEPVPQARLENVEFTCQFEEGAIQLDYHFSPKTLGKRLRTLISYKEETIVELEQVVHDCAFQQTVSLFNQRIDRSDFHGSGWTWTPETPNLFQVKFEIFDVQESLDWVTSYFGMRKVHIQDGMVHLNNRPYYQKLVLDQGYWPQSLMTAPSDAALRQDIELAKAMGFNGCRKHQTISDPRFLYWADKLGFIVWGECASPSVFSTQGVRALTNEWFEIIQRDYNHPCILTWVPINESWGVPEIAVSRQQQHYAQALYHLIHTLDPTRLVISNDGWEMTETDICAVHSYVHGQQAEVAKYEFFKAELRTKAALLGSEPNRRKLYCPGFSNQGEPILLTECGGIGYTPGTKGWGYTNVDSATEFLRDYHRVIDAIYQSEVLHGFCYTQLTDVEQEKNGLLTADREAKVPLAEILKINNQWYQEIIHKI